MFSLAFAYGSDLLASGWCFFTAGRAFLDFGIRFGLGCSNKAEIAAIESALWGGFTGSGDVLGVVLGDGFVATGGVDRFRAFGFSKLAANAVNDGDLPLTLARSGLEDVVFL